MILLIHSRLLLGWLITADISSVLGDLALSLSARQLQNLFLSERVIGYWNKLQSSVRNTASAADLKINLETFRKEHFHLTDTNHFWEVSGEVISKIEGACYVLCR